MAINRKSIITTLFIWAVTAVAAQNSIEIVVHRGANAPGLQSLIDEVSLKGGGRIVFPKGEYPTGQLELKSGVELHLEEGAVILGSMSTAYISRTSVCLLPIRISALPLSSTTQSKLS